MSEYGWDRHYVLWVLPFQTGVKYIASITARLTGENRLEQRYRDKLLEALAVYQRDFNQRHGLGDK